MPLYLVNKYEHGCEYFHRSYFLRVANVLFFKGHL